MNNKIIMYLLAVLVSVASYGQDVEGQPLIFDVEQLSSNASDRDEGRHLENLIDGDISTFWHTDWHGESKDARHYLQVKLDQEMSGDMVVQMVRRLTTDDHPTKMSVQASNNAKDWTDIAYLDFPFEGMGSETLSGPFTLTKPFKYLRFAAEDCTGGSGYGYRVYWHAAEFQLYALGQSLPFRTTRIVKGELDSKTQWYTMTIRGDKTISADGSVIRCISNDPITYNHLWAFVGNANDGFKIYNYATGASSHIYVGGSENQTPLTMVENDPPGGSSTFMLSENSCGGYNFYFPGEEISCFNDHRAENVMTMWYNSNAPHDLGSNITFEPFDPELLKNFVTDLVLSQTSATVYPGKTLQLTCTVVPEDASGKELFWYSTNPEVATVNQEGMVTGVATGKTLIMVYAMDGSGVSATCTVTVPDQSALEPVEGDVRYVYLSDGRVKAYPKAYLKTQVKSSSNIRLTLTNGQVITYPALDVDSFTYVAPTNHPVFTSFKFNNKFNDQLIGDADGEIGEDNVIRATVAGIGKRLTPSFKLSSDDAAAYIENELQTSKVSRPRFAEEVSYTVARHGNTILRRTLGGEFKECPLGTNYTVRVDFLTDHPKGAYNVPTIYINTDNGQMISSKEYYLDAKIRIDGSGVFPDMDETPVQIKGRGNSSWAGTWGKSPYRLRFAEKQKVLGLTKGKNWNLIANAQRESMTSNAIGQRIAQMVGAAAANHEIPVDLYVNGNYRGSYNLTEKVGFSNNSIDLDDESNAVLLELDSYYDEPYKFRTSKYSIPVNIKEPDLSLPGATALTKQSIQSHFNEFINALSAKKGVDSYTDVDYLARFLMVSDLIMNFEFMHPKSTYVYNEDITNPESKYIWGPIWDLDWAYGYEGNGSYFRAEATRNYWSGHSMEVDQFVKDLRYSGDATNRAYYRVWTDFMENHLQELLEYCEDYYEYAAPSFNHDNSQWGNGNANTYYYVTENAKEWLKKRADYIYNFLSVTQGYADRDYLVDDNPEITIGDVNQDGLITTADVVCVLNYILGIENEDFKFSQADADGNELVTIADAVSIIKLVGQEKKVSTRRMRMPEADVSASMHPVVAQPGMTVDVPMDLKIEEGNYCGMQFDLALPVGTTLSEIVLPSEMSGFQLETMPLDERHTRVSIYASGNESVPFGKHSMHIMVDVSSDKQEGIETVSLANSLMVTAGGEDHRLGACSARIEISSATGIENLMAIGLQGGNQLVVESLIPSTLRIYSLDGRLVRLCHVPAGSSGIVLPRGIYVVNNQKIIIR